MSTNSSQLPRSLPLSLSQNKTKGQRSKERLHITHLINVITVFLIWENGGEFLLPVSLRDDEVSSSLYHGEEAAT